MEIGCPKWAIGCPRDTPLATPLAKRPVRQEPEFSTLKHYGKAHGSLLKMDEWFVVTLYVAGLLHTYIQQYFNSW